MTTRLAIDHMRSARRRRERYVGPWLPEPLLADERPGPEERAEVADSVSQAFLVVLESLSPVERAVFLLREVFGFPYSRVAEVVDRSEQSCRQLAARARRHVEAREPRFDPDEAHREELLESFLRAAESGNVESLRGLLAEDAVVYSDGGGVVAAARRPFGGAERIARFMVRVTRFRLQSGGGRRRRVIVNGAPGRLLIGADGRVTDVLTVDVAEGRIQAIRVVRNPEKLRHLQAFGTREAT